MIIEDEWHLILVKQNAEQRMEDYDSIEDKHIRDLMKEHGEEWYQHYHRIETETKYEKPFSCALLFVSGCSVDVELKELDGKNATNSFGKIYIDPDAPDKRAILAAELWEEEWKREGINAFRKTVDSSVREWMEIASHEVEVCAAVKIYGRDEETKRQQEARSMKRGYGGLFSDMSVEEIEARMIERRIPACSWVDRNMNRLMKWKEM